MLCDVSTFVFIFDENEQRCVHYASNTKLDFLSLFNKHCHREFFSNKDYVQLGGRENELDLPDSEEIDD